jgi:hypothetical protein
MSYMPHTSSSKNPIKCEVSLKEKTVDTHVAHTHGPVITKEFENVV